MSAPMGTVDILARLDQVTDKLAGRLDAATDKINARLDTQGDRLARIEPKVDTVPVELAELKREVASNTERQGKSERFQAFLAGIGAVIALLLSSGTVVAIVTSLHHTR